MSRVSVKVIPKSGRSELKMVGNSLKVWLKSAPADGKANDELLRTLADKFGVTKSSVEIISGFSSRNKIVDILGVTSDEIKKIL
jgi:uncharacterized protein (TIGR00251 family)